MKGKRRMCIALAAILLMSSVCAANADETPAPAKTSAAIETPAPTEIPIATQSPAPTQTSAPTETPIATETPVSAELPNITPVPAAPNRTNVPMDIPEDIPEDVNGNPRLGILSGVIIGIDPGHQAHGNNEKEAIAPDSEETKAKVTSGTRGVSTRVEEYVVNLDVSHMLRRMLEDLGATVYMTHETADVDISNQERAKMMNELQCDLVLRIHCNGAENSEHAGIGVYVRKTGTCAEESALAGEYVLSAMCNRTEARRDGLFLRDTYTGLNWSEVPSMIVEMGYMSNPEEDVLLNDPEYQAKLVVGMAEGITAYIMAQRYPTGE